MVRDWPQAGRAGPRDFSEVQMSFTPKPWEMKEVRTSIGVAFRVNEPSKLDDDHGCIACVYSDDTSMNKRPRHEHQANARLMTAAPDLYGALVGLLALWPLPDEGANDTFERIAADFQRETGYLRP